MSPQDAMRQAEKTDWQKVILALATGIVFVLQQWHAMKLEDLKQQVVPRHEIDATASKFMDRDTILTSIKLLSDRMNALEAQDDGHK